MNTRNITNSEMVVMKVVWKKKTCTAAAIVDEVSKNSKWHFRTIKTLLRNLVNKKIVGYTIDENDSRVYHYFPLVKEEDYLRLERQQFVDMYYDGNISTMVASFLKDAKISKNDVKELKEVLERCIEKKDEKE
ncbi:BlaI/MecI/CopY family transcriptional regulator [Bacillus chungangensis]|uniref:BlaI family penicillinase repressor n=1 Tax=Bacillus chungangensis TaxID=587633 RepID=A0ABT9WWU8_9BACI|nr:BlaI/MecI/CopY family transcriptional regulator [Bacillus chungangensis]MDQ0177776.1 BlaI family penicillinase repressor [Bacillus chungangensis]